MWAPGSLNPSMNASLTWSLLSGSDMSPQAMVFWRRTGAMKGLTMTPPSVWGIAIG